VKNLVRILSAVLVLIVCGAIPGSAQDRRFSQGSFFLELGGVKAGWLHSAEGGHATSDVVVEKLGPDRIERKHLGGVKYEDIVLQCGLSMSPAIYDWIGESLKNNYLRKDGSIHVVNHDLQAVSQRKFSQALITDFCVPGCDADAKDEAFMTLKFHADSVTLPQPASGSLVDFVVKNARHKRWIPSNFRLTIDGIDCTRVARIDPLRFKQKPVEVPIGEERDYQKVPASVETPNLVVVFPESHSKSLSDWHEDFVIRGNNGNDHEKSGALEFLSPDGQTVLGTIRFFNLGIFRLVPDTATPKNCDCELCRTVVAGANSRDAGRWLKAEMYCERMELMVPPPTGD